jgi:UDP-N-acetylmuramoylalanine--D-glutamate ligase
MIDVFPFSGYPVAVFGLGRSGRSAALALAASGAEVWAWDDNETSRENAKEQGIPLVDLYNCDWRETTSLVLSPGIPHTHPEPHPIVSLAREADVEIICDVELLARTQRQANTIGITGTNGKSTTTALIGHIMQTSGRDAEIGGNLGTPALDLEPLADGGTYVLEMSSYQLELTLSITFDVAVLLNISADHLERHGGMEGYIAAKKWIFHRQTDPRTAVIGVDDPFSEKIYEQLKETGDQIIIPISSSKKMPGGVYTDGGLLIDDTDGKQTPVCDLNTIPSLPGTHNWQNAAAAYAACKSAGVQPHVIMACLQSYPGLVHRQEAVEIVDGVAYINDSKATNADAAARALACYSNVYWIAGGLAKAGGITTARPYFNRVRHAFLIGQSALQFSQEIGADIPFTLSGELSAAVSQARRKIAEDGVENAVVLLSPAAASFDQYPSFEARGDEFRELVENLSGDHIDPFEDPDLFPARFVSAGEAA